MDKNNGKKHSVSGIFVKLSIWAISKRQMSLFWMDCVTHVIRWKGRGLDHTFFANSVSCISSPQTKPRTKAILMFMLSRICLETPTFNCTSCHVDCGWIYYMSQCLMARLVYTQMDTFKLSGTAESKGQAGYIISAINQHSNAGVFLGAFS